jgi:hypothetical protein
MSVRPSRPGHEERTPDAGRDGDVSRRRVLTGALAVFLCAPAPVAAQIPGLEDLLRGAPQTQGGRRPGEARIAAGLKEALEIGTGKAVDLTGRLDGYLANEAIKILMPPDLRRFESALRTVGFGPQLDELVVGMNRAAERAAPAARAIFVDAITAMTFEDVRRILNGGDTAATEYFQGKTTTRLTTAFRPVVERSLNEVGVARQWKDLSAQARTIPFLNVESFDLDGYVVGKGLDGLFHVLGEEERKIRRDPAARVTDLLKDVFGRR